MYRNATEILPAESTPITNRSAVVKLTEFDRMRPYIVGAWIIKAELKTSFLPYMSAMRGIAIAKSVQPKKNAEPSIPIVSDEAQARSRRST